MRKALWIIAIVVLALVPVAAYALIVHSPARADLRSVSGVSANRQQLTPQQQADIEESYQESLELRKQTIDRMAADGLLTEEQGKLALERYEEMLSYHAGNGSPSGYGMWNGCGGSIAYEGYAARGRMRGYDWD